MPQAGWKHEHPNALNDLDQEFLAKFLDHSYHNDAEPMFVMHVDDKRCILLCIDYEHISDRELKDGKRFNLAIVDRDQDTYDLNGEIEDFYYGDDFNQVKEIVLSIEIAENIKEYKPVKAKEVKEFVTIDPIKTKDINESNELALAKIISDENIWKKSHRSIDGGVYCMLCDAQANTYEDKPIVHKESCPLLLAKKIIKE